MHDVVYNYFCTECKGRPPLYGGLTVNPQERFRAHARNGRLGCQVYTSGHTLEAARQTESHFIGRNDTYSKDGAGNRNRAHCPEVYKEGQEGFKQADGVVATLLRTYIQ